MQAWKRRDVHIYVTRQKESGPKTWKGPFHTEKLKMCKGTKEAL